MSIDRYLYIGTIKLISLYSILSVLLFLINLKFNKSML